MSARAVMALVALALVAGCATAPPGPPPVPATISARHERRLADGRLALAVVLATPGPRSGGAPVVCQFYDAAGKPVGTLQAQTIVLQPGETGTVQFAADTAAAVSADVSVARPAGAGR